MRYSGTPNPVQELDAEINGWWSDVSKLERFRDCNGYTHPEVTPEDATSFLKGLRRKLRPLFCVTAENRFMCRCMPRWERRQQTAFEARELKDGERKAWFRAETIVHHAALTELIDRWGWPEEQVICEPDLDPHHRTGTDEQDVLNSPGSLDVVTFEGSGSGRRYLIAMEAKGDPDSLHRLVREMVGCRGANTGAHTRGIARPLADDEKSLHRKCMGLMHYRPHLFWAAAPGIRDLYLVRYSDGDFELIPTTPTQRFASSVTPQRP